MSDQMHLMNFSGHKKAWPVYLRLGNLPSTWRNSPTSMVVLLVALLPIPPKQLKSSKADQHRGHINADTLGDVSKFILLPLQDPVCNGVPIDCANGKVRRCFPILAGWIADHMENVGLYRIKYNFCPRCDVPMGELGGNTKVNPVRDYTRYHRFKDGNRIAETEDEIRPAGLGISFGKKWFLWAPPGFALRSTQTRYALYRLPWNIQGHDRLDTGRSEEARTTGSIRRSLEEITTLPRIPST